MKKPFPFSPSRSLRWFPGPLDFLKTFRRVLGFGFLCSFLSGFGQTYFISLFVPSLSTRLGVEPGEIGPFYAAATLCSGLLLSRAGKRAGMLLKRGWSYEDLLDALFVTSLLCLLGTVAVMQFHNRNPSDARKPLEKSFRRSED